MKMLWKCTSKMSMSLFLHQVWRKVSPKSGTHSLQSIHCWDTDADTFLQTWWRNKLLYIWIARGWTHNQQIDTLGWVFNLHLPSSTPPTHLPGLFRQNLRSLSPSRLSSVVSSCLHTPTHFSSLNVNCATNTLCTCHITSRPACVTPSSPWLTDVLCENWTKLF